MLWGDAIGHLGLKEDNHESGDEQRDEATFAGMHKDSDSYPDEERPG
jgi:hypothetical protein